jgi:hypothetical protein
MQTRKEFCRTCLALAAAGVGARQVFGNPGSGAKGDKEVSKTEVQKKAKIVAYCGITCSECPAYIATQKNDDALRRETAKKWSEMFKADIKPQDINCDGCPSDSERIFNHCRVCEIRKCGREKKVKNCAGCAEYPCPKLSAFLDQVPEAKATLEELRKAR